MKFKTSFAELPIPLENVDVIHLSKEGRQPSTVIPTGSMRATLKGRGRLTMKIEEWKDGKITAISPTFGKTVIDATALKSVEFNLGKSRTASTAQPSRTTTSTIRNRPGAFGVGVPQVIEQRLGLDRIPVRPLPRKR